MSIGFVPPVKRCLKKSVACWNKLLFSSMSQSSSTQSTCWFLAFPIVNWTLPSSYVRFTLIMGAVSRNSLGMLSRCSETSPGKNPWSRNVPMFLTMWSMLSKRSELTRATKRSWSMTRICCTKLNHVERTGAQLSHGQQRCHSHDEPDQIAVSQLGHSLSWHYGLGQALEGTQPSSRTWVV